MVIEWYLFKYVLQLQGSLRILIVHDVHCKPLSGGIKARIKVMDDSCLWFCIQNHFFIYLPLIMNYCRTGHVHVHEIFTIFFRISVDLRKYGILHANIAGKAKDLSSPEIGENFMHANCPCLKISHFHRSTVATYLAHLCDARTVGSYTQIVSLETTPYIRHPWP